MALNSSGPISLGGSTAGQSVNLELGQSATAQISFNDADVRSLTGTSSGTALIMPTNFYGKSAGLESHTVVTGTVGSALNENLERGYSLPDGYGSISPTTSAIYSSATVRKVAYVQNGPPYAYVLQIGATVSNSGWTTMTIAGTKALTRTSATFSTAGGISTWTWTTTDTGSTQAFGTAGTNVSVVFT